MTSPAASSPGQSTPDAPDRPVSKWAVATFGLGLVSAIPLSIAAGVVAFAKTRDGREAGRGLAVAGLVISVVWAAVWAYSFWPKDGLITGTLQSDRVGSCFRGDVNSPVSCDKPHADEVFAMLALSRFPDSDAEQRQIDTRCQAELPNYSPIASRDPSIRVEAWSPGTEWRQLDTHAAGCVAHSSGFRSSSIKMGPAFSWNSP